MTYRVTGARGGTSVVERSLLQLARGLESVARRVEKIESSNRVMPRDTVLERGDDGFTVWLRRISTGESWQIVPSVGTEGGGGLVDEEWVLAQIYFAVAGIVHPEVNGVTAGEVDAAIADAFAAYTPPPPPPPVGVLTQVAYTVGAGTGIYVLTHPFGRDLQVTAYEVDPPYAEVIVSVEHTTVTEVTVAISPTPAAASVRVVISGSEA